MNTLILDSHAKATGRFFIRLPEVYKQYFPTMSKYFGKPLKLRKSIYGLTLSGNFLVTEFSEWLPSQGFTQSKAEPAYFILYKDEATWLRMISYVDDMLYFGSNEQVRTHQHKDGSYSLNQTRYTSNIIHKYNPKPVLGVYPNTDLPRLILNMSIPKKTDPCPRRRKMILKENVLAWTSGQLSALFYTWLLEQEVTSSSSHANWQRIGSSDILAFTNASWQDYPDTGRSTTGYYIFYKRCIIEGNLQNIWLSTQRAWQQLMITC
eukprot:15365274-Ditylum_brightwellii.AAC.1